MRHGFPTARQELLLKAAVLDGDAALTAWRRWLELDSVDAADADSMRMMPLLCRNLLALQPDDPELDALKSVYRHEWVANQHHLHRAGAALRVLARAGLETMVLKGAAVAQQHYGDIGVRPMLDVDVLVRTERTREAADALTSAGWNPLVPTDLELLLPVTNGMLFREEPGGGVDLHWHSLWSPAVEDDFWDAAERAEVGGEPTLAQCPADQVLHICVHGLWSEGMRIRWVADAVAVLRSVPGLDWDRVVDRARARALTLPLAEALAYLRGTFGATVPEEVLRALAATPRGLRERAGHRAWMAPSTRLRTAVLVWERYRRQRALAPGPVRARNFRHYVRCHAATAWQLDPRRPVSVELVRRALPRASRFAPERP